MPETVEVCIRVDFQGIGNIGWTEQSNDSSLDSLSFVQSSSCRNIKRIVSRTWALLKPDWSDYSDDERWDLRDLRLQVGIRFYVVEDELGVGLWMRLG